MLTDRYGLSLSTTSAAARDAYVEGCDLLLTLYPGAVAALDRAIAVDPGFALAYVAKARALQLAGNMPAMHATMEQAEKFSPGLPTREATHVEVFRHLFAGQAEVAFTVVCALMETTPRDALVLGTTANQIGLIGLSGRAGREQELADFLGKLAPHYGDDWWFNAHYAMALSESSQQAAARPLIEQSLAQNPRNAYGAHAFAHLCYEEGERDGAIAFMHGWLPDYPRDGLLHGHLNWHLALFELQRGNAAEGFRLYRDAFARDDYPAPPMLKLVDAAAFLWRAELAGHARDTANWNALHEFAEKNFPKPGMPLADWHIALTEAIAGDGTNLEARARTMEDMVSTHRYPAGPAVPALTRAFAAFQRRDYTAAIAAIEPMLAERERIGGSRAQVDLVEFTLMKAYLATGRSEDARRLLQARRPGPNQIPVAGLETLH